jgi:hypothetical protein
MSAKNTQRMHTGKRMSEEQNSEIRVQHAATRFSSKKVVGLTGKWGNDFARAPRLTPNRRTSIELSPRLAIRKRHYCSTSSLFPLSALHKRDVPTSENEKLPSKWEKRPVSV